MNKENQGFPQIFDSTEVTTVVGISTILLNKFVERKSYGIEPSIRAGKGPGSRRLFSDEDVMGIALVWWLFEAGLRSEAIEDIIAELCVDVPNVSATDAAWTLVNGKYGQIAIKREPRISAKSRSADAKPKQEVLFIEEGDWQHALRKFLEDETASVLFIPVGERFAKLKDSMLKLGPSARKSQRS
jgi:hypothetical protein